MKRATVFVILVFAFAYQFGCQRSSTNDGTANSGNAAAPSPSPAEADVQPETTTATSAAKSSRCGDSPPANPSKCTVNQPFVVGCNPPWASAQNHDIDARCPIEGCAKRDSDKAQNRVKNNICATGTPVSISVSSIDKLQADVDKLVEQGQLSYGKTGPPEPADRAKLQGLSTVDSNKKAITLSEGNLVIIDAVVFDAKHDDTFPFGFGGEGVNCNNSLLEWNDIHVALVEPGSTQECSSVTAEIIPHFRSVVWDRFDSNECTSPHVTNPLPVKGLRVRITGQLFFDGSHLPAPCGSPPGGGNPLRRSVWEIHPAYAIEVFDTKTKKFITLEDWAQGK